VLPQAARCKRRISSLPSSLTAKRSQYLISLPKYAQKVQQVMTQSFARKEINGGHGLSGS
jgi:hypothetical protein